MDGNANPLFVDLDGTLLNSDLLLESLLLLLRRQPLAIFLIPVWLLRGRAWLKHQIAIRVRLRPELLPYNAPLLAYLELQKKAGRRLILISASNQLLLGQVADHLGLFAAVHGSDDRINLKGREKLRVIQDLSGHRAFDYAGNNTADLAIWEKAANAITVNAGKSLNRRAAALTRVSMSIDSSRSTLPSLVLALRPHQWLKNGLLFLPLVLAHRVNEAPLIQQSVLGFLAFCLCASGIYLLNDMLDLEADRQHASKRRRPFAAGDLPLSWGFLLNPLLILLAFLLSLLLPAYFTLSLGVYLLFTLLYSFSLKSVAIVDVLVLAGLYTLRIIAGAAAIEVVTSFWLLAFSMFLFLSLAIVKRFTELDNLRGQTRQFILGRGYDTGDIQVMSMLGSASGFMAVLVFALYINAEETRILYGRPEMLWLICPLLLYLICRIWLLAHRGTLHEDPVVFAMTDHSSQIVVLLCGLLLWAATGSG